MKKEKEKLSERMADKLIAWERPDLDEESVDEFIIENQEEYDGMLKVINLIISFCIIYPILLLINGAVIMPIVVPGLSIIQNVAINFPAIISIPIWPVFYWKCAPKYRVFKQKLNEYKR